MNAITTHRTAFKWANEILEMTMADSSAELAGWTPPGIANSIAATYAHAICGADGIVHGMLQAGTPLYAGEWAHKTGISDPRMDQTLEWARTVTVDLAVVRQYAEAVCASVDRFIVSLSEADLERELDLSSVGLGMRSLDWCLSALVTGHINNMAGEISALKGVQGARGYPF